MLTLLVNDVQVPLAPDIKIPIKLLNPMFHEQGSHSFHFDIPNTPAAARAFAYPERISNINHLKFYPAKLLFNNYTIVSGELAIENANKITYRGFLCLDNSSFKAKVREKILTDLKTPVFMPTYDAQAWGDMGMASVSSGYPQYDFVFFPFYDALYSNRKDPLLCNTFRGKYAEEGVAGGHIPPDIPFFYVHSVINWIFHTFNYNISDYVFSKKPELNKLVLINIKGPNPAYIDMTNLTYASFLPPIKILSFLDAFFNSINAKYFINETLKTVEFRFKEDVITSIPSAVDRLPQNYEKDIEELKTGFKFEHNQPDPDTYFKSRCPQEFASANVFPPVSSYSELLTKRDKYLAIRLVKEMGYYYIDNGETVKQWEPYMPDYLFEEGDKDIDIKSGSAYLDTGLVMNFTYVFQFGSAYLGYATAGEAKYSMRIPRFDLPAEDIEKVTKPIFMFYRGLKEGVAPSFVWYPAVHFEPQTSRPPQVIAELAVAYPWLYWHPYATSGVAGPGQIKMPDANLSWAWQGEYGLYENFWQKWLYWYQYRRQNINMKIDFTFRELSQLKPWQLLHLHGINAMYSEITGNITPNGLELNPAKLIK